MDVNNLLFQMFYEEGNASCKNIQNSETLSVNKRFVNKKKKTQTGYLCTCVFFVSPKRHPDVHEFGVTAENVPRRMNLQEDHVTVC